MLQLQLKIINLCKEELRKQDQLSLLSQILKLVPASAPDFKRDLEAAISKLKAPTKAGKYTISETDDPCDLLLIGTEIMDSCQNVNGQPNLNKCLVSYLLDGKTKAIVVKGPDNRIVARSMLRLLWDDRHKRPVLLQERIYSNILDKDVSQAIDQWAKERAESLGLTLVSIERGSGIPYDGTVLSLGGPVPFEYSDAGGGVKRGGKYEVANSHVVTSLKI